MLIIVDRLMPNFGGRHDEVIATSIDSPRGENMTRTKKIAHAVIIAALAYAVQGKAWADDAATPSSPMNPAPAMQGGDNAGKGSHMMQALGLTDDQMQKFKAEQKQFREAAKPLRDKVKSLRETLASQVKGKAADADINTTISSLESAQKDLDAARESHEATLKGILSPIQYAQVILQMSEEMHEHAAEHTDAAAASAPAPDAASASK
jgi:Spy/CpxP family protein refolding chaperone